MYAAFDKQYDYSQWMQTLGNIMFTENSAHSWIIIVVATVVYISFKKVLF